jgi:hypothetical protein
VTAGLTIVGLGPAGPGQATLEAADALRQAHAAGAWVGGFGHAAAVARALAPDLAVEHLEYFYLLPLPRPQVYALIADLVLAQVQRHGRAAVFLAEGSPLVLNTPVALLRQRCAAAGVPLRLVHGLAFLELVLEGVQWTGPNLQCLSARGVALGHTSLQPGTPALLYQLGEHTATTAVLDTARSVDLLAALRDQLLRAFPPDHPVTVLASSGPPDYANVARPLALYDLAAEPVPIYSNLWVPPHVAA